MEDLIQYGDIIGKTVVWDDPEECINRPEGFTYDHRKRAMKKGNKVYRMHREWVHTHLVYDVKEEDPTPEPLTTATTGFKGWVNGKNPKRW